MWAKAYEFESVFFLLFVFTHLLFRGSWSCGHPGDSGGQSTCHVFAALLCFDLVIWLPCFLAIFLARVRSQLSSQKPQVVLILMRKRFWSLSLSLHPGHLCLLFGFCTEMFSITCCFSPLRTVELLPPFKVTIPKHTLRICVGINSVSLLLSHVSI